jgi:capsular polysaccharide export protein
MRIGLATSGLLRLKPFIEQLLGGKAVLLSRSLRRVDIVAGWGHKPTADKARRYATKHGLRYVAFEDGLIRSVHPGNAELPLSLVIDRQGIYYDARVPSELEDHIRRLTREGDPDTFARARTAIDFLRKNRLSKYNNHPFDDLSALSLTESGPDNRVLLVDQTAGDASIAGAMAAEETFEAMLLACAAENPDRELLIKVHPETLLGRKGGHFDRDSLSAAASREPVLKKALEEGRLKLVAKSINPWALLDACSKVYCVSSQLGFEALLAKREVHCFGVPFYAGWGLTKDRVSSPKRRTSAPLEALTGAFYFEYSRYPDHMTGGFIEFEEAAQRLVDLRDGLS